MLTNNIYYLASTLGVQQTPDLQYMYQMDFMGMKMFTEKLELILTNSDELQVQVRA